MNIVSLIIILAVVVAFALALRHYLRSGGPTNCGSCTGDCSRCSSR